MAPHAGDIENHAAPPMTVISDKGGVQAVRFAGSAAGGFEVLSFWGVLAVMCGGLMVFRPLIPPGWLDSMVLADMLLHGWVGDNSKLTTQFLPVQAVEPGQLSYLILAGIDAVVGPLLTPVIAAILSLVLFALALHALVSHSGRQSARNSWPLSIVALTAISGVVLHRYPPSVFFGLTFGISALALWRHRFFEPDVIGTVLLALALTLTIGMDFQIFLGVTALLLLSVLWDGLLEIIHRNVRRAAITFAFRLVLLGIALIPAALMLAYYIRNNSPDWPSVLALMAPARQLDWAPLAYAGSGAAFPLSAEPQIILALGGLVGLILLAGLIFRPFRGALDRSDILLAGGCLLTGLAMTRLSGSLLETSGPLTGAKTFWLGLTILIVWAVRSPMPRLIRLGFMVAVILVTSSLTGNRVLSYEHLAGQADRTGLISNLVKRGSFVAGIDFTGDGAAGRVAGLSILQRSAIGLTLPELSADAQTLLLENNPPLRPRLGRALTDILGTGFQDHPESIRLQDFENKTGHAIGSIFIMGTPPLTPAGNEFVQRLKQSHEPVYKFTSGSLRGLVLYQQKPPETGFRP